ncbi:MAG: sulfate ABC transporter permease subunit CysT [Capsulimonadaceae bacterium]
MATAIAIAGKGSRRSSLPGFGLTLGYALFYLALLVLAPLAMLFVRAHAQSWHDFWSTVTDSRVVAAYQLSFGASLAAAGVNVVLGTLCAWVLARYRFPGRRFIDGLIDLPFALPTSVAGISLTTLFSKDGWLGRYLEPHHIAVDYTPLGITIALIFIGMPFVVRTVQPVLEDIDRDVEEAAASLGAPRWQTVTRVVLPTLIPPAITGFALAFARALGEYGSVVFIAGNIPYKTEIVPLVITSKLDEYDYSGATAVAAVMLVASFLLLLAINGLQAWTRRHHGEI